MSFNLKKYLVENNLTLISKKREALKEDEDQPSAADVQSAEKQMGTKGLDDKIRRYNEIKNKMKELAVLYKKGDNSVIDMLKALTAEKKKLEQELNKHIG